jgi:hypothetical protein
MPSKNLPALRYWFTTSTAFTIGAYLLATALGLMGVPTWIPREAVIALILASAGLLILGLVSAAQQEERNEQLREDLKRIGQISNLRPYVQMIEDYQKQLSGFGQKSLVLAEIVGKYDELMQAVTIYERSIGSERPAERLAVSQHILNELKVQLAEARTLEWGGGRALIIKTGHNVFRVTFNVPMRQPPNIEFFNLPPGATTTVTEISEIGFAVSFSPPSISVQAFDFTASAEI